MDITNILLSAQQGDKNAESQLVQFEKQDFPNYLYTLCTELTNEAKPTTSRQIAGLALKNALVAKSDAEILIRVTRWLGLPEAAREQIKAMLLQVMGNSLKLIRSTSALAVAGVASIEVPKGLWATLMPTLVQNITAPNTTPFLRQSSFEAMGYVCEQVPEYLQVYSNAILNAIATGMKAEETDEIKLAATVCLANSLDFVKANFANAAERDIIMKMVFTSIQSSDVQVRVAAYQCLVEIASSYYEYIASYMNDIFGLTTNAISKEEDDVVQQAIEFWSTICDEEMNIQEEIRDAEYEERPAERALNNYATAALPHLIPLLLMTLTKQHEDVDDDEWNSAMAAGTCLGLFSQTTADHVVQHVLPFVQQNIQNPNWRFREAATLAFGCILDGPSSDKLASVVEQALPLMLAHTKDSSDVVRDTAAWTIGRICNLVPHAIQPAILPALCQSFFDGLADKPKIATNHCWAIHNLAQAAEIGIDDPTSPLSPYFEGLVTRLLGVTERPDSHEANLLSGAYEAINVMISNAAPDVYGLVAQLIPTLQHRLNATLQNTGLSGQEREKINEAQALICGSLQSIITKLDESVILPHADACMVLFLKVLESKNATVHEEALMAIGSVANRTGKNFEKYVGAFKDYLLRGLSNLQEYKVCSIAVGVVGDLSRALEEKFVIIADNVMTLLLSHLQNPECERSVKPHIISCLGDIALAIGGVFERYLPFVVRMLNQAAGIKAEHLDEDSFDYLVELRTSILESYTGIIQGLGAENKAHLIINDNGLDSIVGLFDTLVAEKNLVEDQVLRAAVGLVGDIAFRIGQAAAPAVTRPSAKKILTTAKKSQDENIKETAEWADSVVKSFR